MTCKYCGLELNLGGLKYPEVRVRLHYSMVHGSKDLEIEEPRVAYPRSSFLELIEEDREILRENGLRVPRGLK